MVLVCDDVGLDTVETVFVVVSFVSVCNDEEVLGDDVIGYIELLSVEFIVLVTGLIEDCKTLIELVLLGTMVVNIEVFVNGGIVFVLK
jgi:hypothetical protein